jgi:hypothetical protein
MSYRLIFAQFPTRQEGLKQRNNFLVNLLKTDTYSYLEPLSSTPSAY